MGKAGKAVREFNRNGQEEAAQNLSRDLQAIGQVWKFRIWLVKDTVLRLNTETGESCIFNHESVCWTKIKEPDGR